MTERAALFAVALALYTLALNVGLKKVTRQKKGFPICYQCEQQMAQAPDVGRSLPNEIQHYLAKYDLPRQVVRRYVCVKGHRQLWIAPPVGGEKKSVIVSHKL